MDQITATFIDSFQAASNDDKASALRQLSRKLDMKIVVPKPHDKVRMSLSISHPSEDDEHVYSCGRCGRYNLIPSDKIHGAKQDCGLMYCDLEYCANSKCEKGFCVDCQNDLVRVSVYRTLDESPWGPQLYDALLCKDCFDLKTFEMGDFGKVNVTDLDGFALIDYLNFGEVKVK